MNQDYGISKNRYRELLYFCRQYSEWKEDVKNQKEGYKIKKEYIAIVERAAVKTDLVLSKQLLDNVTEGICYEQLGEVLINRNDFFSLRRKFFYILDQEKIKGVYRGGG
jgi:hypothetical protein